jgi:hypothetical protein
MPREDRRLYFDYEETLTAVQELCAQKGITVPTDGRILHAAFYASNPSEVEFSFENLRFNRNQKLKYSKDFIVAALMIACAAANIPLPKGTLKSLELDKDSVILRIQTNR